MVDEVWLYINERLNTHQVVSTLGNGREVAGEQVDNVIARILRVMQNLGCTIVVLRELISSDVGNFVFDVICDE